MSPRQHRIGQAVSAIYAERRPGLIIKLMTDSEQGSREWDSLRRRVVGVFEAPEGLVPVLTDAIRRSWLRLWTHPSFDNHGCWTIWGPSTSDQTVTHFVVRRIIWRADLDGDRGNPMRRLQRIGQPLEPTFEVADGSVGADELAKRLRSLPLPERPARLLLTPRPIALDGERYGLEIDANLARCRIEWFGVNRDWTPSDEAYSPIARWSKEFCGWLDGMLDDT
jgi:hypothetical protein